MPQKSHWPALPVIVALSMPGVAWATQREQLPTEVTPLRYDLDLVPDLVRLTFSGRVKIAIAVGLPTSSIMLNADELVLDKAVLDSKTAAIALDTKLQRATLRFERPVTTGSHSLTIDYHGAIGKSTMGFFAMDYDGPSGKRRMIATNF
ncbi:MAG: hypothetical protein WAM39_22105 [Bryobacteraceae bacterium]